MDKKGQAKKNLKLNETDRKVLISYLDTPINQMMKPKIETIYDKKIMKLL